MKTKLQTRLGVPGAWLLLASLVGCSGGEDAGSATPPADPGASAGSAGSAATPDEPAPTPEVAPEPTPTVTELTAQVAPADHGTWVDLLHTVRTTVAATAFRDEATQLPHMYDGDPLTAWNSATLPAGDDAPRSVYVRLPEGVRVHAIDITAGFTKVRPQGDLFTQNLRIRRLRVRHPGGEVLVTLNPEERALQRIPVEGAGGDWQLELLEWVPGSNANWRELVISELVVWGEADASVPRSTLPQAVVGTLPAAAIAAEVAAGDPVADGAGGEDGAGGAAPAGPVLAQRDGLRATRMELASAMDGRTPVDPRTTYSKTEDDQIFCYFELANPERVATMVTLAWEDANGQGRGAPTEIQVPGNARFVNFRYTSVSWRRPGTYSCVVRHEDSELGRAEFTVTP